MMAQRVQYCQSFFPSVFTSHSASNSQVSQVSKIVFAFLIMLEARWTAVEMMSDRGTRNGSGEKNPI